MLSFFNKQFMWKYTYIVFYIDIYNFDRLLLSSTWLLMIYLHLFLHLIKTYSIFYTILGLWHKSQHAKNTILTLIMSSSMQLTINWQLAMNCRSLCSRPPSWRTARRCCVAWRSGPSCGCSREAARRQSPLTQRYCQDGPTAFCAGCWIIVYEASYRMFKLWRDILIDHSAACWLNWHLMGYAM